MTTFIYALICPETSQIMYIGKSNNPQRRAKDHMSDWRGAEVGKITWLRKLKSKGMKPVLEIIDEVSREDWQYWEIFWIAYYKFLGSKLLNIEEGGQGLTEANAQTFRKKRRI